MIDKDLHARWKFFYEHDGWATPPGKAVCAWYSAKAEHLAEQSGLTFEWVPDDAPDLSWADKRDLEIANNDGVWGCICKAADGTTLNSLWGIVGWDRDYVRCVQAALAQESLSMLHTVTP